jgi:hypothetical protein
MSTGDLTLSQKELAFVDRRFLTLFIFLLASLAFYPYAESSRFGYFAFRMLASAAILLSIYAARLHRTVLFFALALAIPAVVHRVVFPVANPGFLSVSNELLSFTFDVFVVVVIFRHVFSWEETNSEAVFAALCIYLLVGFSFASVYGLVLTFQPNAFYLDPHTNLHLIPDRFDFIYYSFGTMTSLGAAGITPVTSVARAITVVEAILGVLYLAALIARLMVGYSLRRN